MKRVATIAFACLTLSVVSGCQLFLLPCYCCALGLGGGGSTGDFLTTNAEGEQSLEEIGPALSDDGFGNAMTPAG